MLVDRCGIPWMLNCQKPAYVQNERERVLALDIDVFVLIAQKQCLKLRHVPLLVLTHSQLGVTRLDLSTSGPCASI
jgi:hypothetical protein